MTNWALWTNPFHSIPISQARISFIFCDLWFRTSIYCLFSINTIDKPTILSMKHPAATWAVTRYLTQDAPLLNSFSLLAQHIRAVQGDCQWLKYFSENSHQSRNPTMHCRLPIMQCRWGVSSYLDLATANWRPCLVHYWQFNSQQVRTVKQSIMQLWGANLRTQRGLGWWPYSGRQIMCHSKTFDTVFQP